MNLQPMQDAVGIARHVPHCMSNRKPAIRLQFCLTLK
jgi:hypothetical protein